MARKVFSDKELETLFRMKEQNCTNKQISEVLKCNIDAVKKRLYRTKLKASLPPKEKLPRSSVNGRLALLTQRLMKEYPKTPYCNIPGKLREVYKVEGDLPSYKAFERFLKQSNMNPR